MALEMRILWAVSSVTVHASGGDGDRWTTVCDPCVCGLAGIDCQFHALRSMSISEAQPQFECQPDRRVAVDGERQGDAVLYALAGIAVADVVAVQSVQGSGTVTPT